MVRNIVQLTAQDIKAKTDLIGASVALESGGNVASIKAKTDNIANDYIYRQLMPLRGKVIQGTWIYSSDAASTEYISDLVSRTAGYWFNNSGVLGDEYDFFMFLPAGDYFIEMWFYTDPASGVLKVYFDDQLLGSGDFYTASPQHNSLVTWSFTIPADKSANLRFLSNTKNALATGYKMYFQRITLWRSA